MQLRNLGSSIVKCLIWFYNIADRAQGYCLDDNSRALLLMAIANQQSVKGTEQLIQIYLGFIQQMQDKNGWFRNFMNYTRHIAK